MRKILLASCFGVASLFTAGYAVANEELTKLSADPNQWVMPTGNFANTRYSELKQINADTPCAVSQHSFCARPQQRGQDPVEV